MGRPFYYCLENEKGTQKPDNSFTLPEEVGMVVLNKIRELYLEMAPNSVDIKNHTWYNLYTTTKPRSLHMSTETIIAIIAIAAGMGILGIFLLPNPSFVKHKTLTAVLFTVVAAMKWWETNKMNPSNPQNLNKFYTESWFLACVAVVGGYLFSHNLIGDMLIYTGAFFIWVKMVRYTLLAGFCAVAVNKSGLKINLKEGWQKKMGNMRDATQTLFHIAAMLVCVYFSASLDNLLFYACMAALSEPLFCVFLVGVEHCYLPESCPDVTL